jgi:DNA mismatch repair protein MutH
MQPSVAVLISVFYYDTAKPQARNATGKTEKMGVQGKKVLVLPKGRIASFGADADG